MKKLLLIFLCLPMIFSCTNKKTGKYIKEEEWADIKENCMEVLADSEFEYYIMEKYCSCVLAIQMEKYSSLKELTKATESWTMEDYMKEAELCIDSVLNNKWK